MVFFVCLSVFPSVTARIVPMKKDESAWTSNFIKFFSTLMFVKFIFSNNNVFIGSELSYFVH